MAFREEKDSLGIVNVPEDAYYGAQTQRAFENFPVSDLQLPPAFFRTLALIKKCAAEVNRDLGLLDETFANAVIASAQEVMDGKFMDQFGVDVFQTGSGTSTNMNMNEVLATRSNERLTGKKEGKSPVHPNDHVNLGQSSNDVIPTTIHVTAFAQITKQLIPSLERLQEALTEKTVAFKDIHKIGRTHLQDAVPITLGQEFSGYAGQIERGIDRLHALEPRLGELALGGTAVGTGVNTHPEFAAGVIALMAEGTGLPLKETTSHFQAQSAQDTAVETSGVLKTIAVSFTKIANDIRWLAAGPRCGIGELTIPSLQPGSSIMPGKVNPVIPESVLQVAMQVIGNDATITIGGQAGNFELNVALPVIAYNLLQSIGLLERAAVILTDKCILELTANQEKCASYIEKSLARATSLVPHLGYDKAAAIAKKAFEMDLTVKEVAFKDKVLPEDLLNRLFTSS